MSDTKPLISWFGTKGIILTCKQSADRGTSRCAARLARGPDCLANRVCSTLLRKSTADKRTEKLTRCDSALRTPSKPQTQRHLPLLRTVTTGSSLSHGDCYNVWDPLHYPLAPSDFHAMLRASAPHNSRPAGSHRAKTVSACCCTRQGWLCGPQPRTPSEAEQAPGYLCGRALCQYITLAAPSTENIMPSHGY